MADEPLRPAANQRVMPIGRRFQPGQSGNPGGQPKGLVTMIREQTRDGAELVEIMLNIARGNKIKFSGVKDDQVIEIERSAGIPDRMDAIKWLTDRGWGKAAELIKIESTDKRPVQIILLENIGDPLEQEEDVQRVALPAPPEIAPPEVGFNPDDPAFKEPTE